MPHRSAILLNELFIKTYQIGWQHKENKQVLEQGAGGSDYKNLFVEKNFAYLDYDITVGKEDSRLPWNDDTFDVVISNSVYEHDTMFWLSFNEQLRVLKPDGLLLITAPSNGPFHRYPTDCWRFYPDAGTALVRWAQLSGHKQAALLESFTGEKHQDVWCDYAMVVIKDQQHVSQYPKRMMHNVTWAGITNAQLYGNGSVHCSQSSPQDQRSNAVPVQQWSQDLLI